MARPWTSLMTLRNANSVPGDFDIELAVETALALQFA